MIRIGSTLKVFTSLGLLLTIFAAFLLPVFTIDSNVHGQIVIDSPQIAYAETEGERRAIDIGKSSSAICSEASYAQFIPGCLALGAFHLASFFVTMSGAFFDYMLAFTLDSNFLKNPAIEETWEKLRDLANLAFVLGIIIVSFQLITGQNLGSNLDWKNLLKNLIIVALLLNFSLFAARVVIDAGNVTANVFYNSLNVTGQAYGGGTINTGAGAVEVKSFSGAVMQAINVPQLVDKTIFNSISQQSDPFWPTFVLFVFLSVILFFIAKTLLIAGFMFISRTAYLIVLMIVSPLAFVAWFLPKTQSYFDSWWKELWNKSFCIAVFLFFFYVLIIIVNKMNLAGSMNLSGSDSAGGNLDLLYKHMLLVAIQFGLAYIILEQAREQVVKMCEGGKGIGSIAMAGAQKVASFAMTGPVGAGAFARNIVGSAAMSAANSGFVKNVAEKSATGRMFARSLEGISDSKFGTAQSFKEIKDTKQKRVKDEMNKYVKRDKFDSQEEFEKAQRNFVADETMIGRMLDKATRLPVAAATLGAVGVDGGANERVLSELKEEQRKAAEGRSKDEEYKTKKREQDEALYKKRQQSYTARDGVKGVISQAADGVRNGSASNEMEYVNQQRDKFTQLSDAFEKVADKLAQANPAETNQLENEIQSIKASAGNDIDQMKTLVNQRSAQLGGARVNTGEEAAAFLNEALGHVEQFKKQDEDQRQQYVEEMKATSVEAYKQIADQLGKIAPDASGNIENKSAAKAATDRLANKSVEQAERSHREEMKKIDKKYKKDEK